MVTFAQPVITLAPTAPLALTMSSPLSQPFVTLAPTLPMSLVVGSDGPAGQLFVTSGGTAGTVSSVNGEIGAVLVLGPLVNQMTDQLTVSPNLSAAGHFVLTLTENTTFANPTGLTVDRQRWMLEVIQGGSGGYGISWGGNYDFGASIGIPTLSSTPGKRDFLGFVSNLSTGIQYCVGFVQGY